MIPSFTGDVVPERDVLACVLSASLISSGAGRRVLARARGTGLEPHYFYYASLGGLYDVMCDLADSGDPVDPISIAAEIDRRATDALPLVHGYVDVDQLRARLHLLAHEVTAFGVVEHRARLVVAAWRARQEASGTEAGRAA